MLTDHGVKMTVQRIARTCGWKLTEFSEASSEQFAEFDRCFTASLDPCGMLAVGLISARLIALAFTGLMVIVMFAMALTTKLHGEHILLLGGFAWAMGYAGTRPIRRTLVIAQELRTTRLVWNVSEPAAHYGRVEADLDSAIEAMLRDSLKTN